MLTSTRRSFALSGLAASLVKARPVASKVSAPTQTASPAASDTLTQLDWEIDLMTYVAGWRPAPQGSIAIFGHRDTIVMDAFDLADGMHAWSTDLRAAFPDTPFSENGFAIAPRWGTSVVISFTNAAEMFGVDSASGEALWHLNMNAPTGLANGFGTNVALANARLGGGGEKTRLFSLDERTGNVQWETNLPIDGLWIATDAPVVNDIAAYLVDKAMRIHAVTPESGEHAWTRELEPEHQLVYMQTFGDVVLANLEWNGVKRIDPETGEDIWSNPDFLPLDDIDVTTNGSLVIGVDPAMEAITAIDLASGDTRWQMAPGPSATGFQAQARNDDLMTANAASRSLTSPPATNAS
jgi:outer membrane protein assembly factor BamB